MMAKVCTCPDVATLERLVVGNVAPQEAESLEEHLALCERCQACLGRLEVSDPLVERLRGSEAIAAQLPQGEVLDALMRRLRETPMAPIGPANDTAGNSPSEYETPTIEPAPDLTDLLAPPQGPDELGWLGTYRVIKVLGVGGMGLVLQAEDTQLQRPVALKVVKPSLATSAAARERFRREARAAAALPHDHIVTIYQVGEEHGVSFLAMQLLEGESLENRLQREGNLPIAEVLRIGRETAEGLAAAHAKGLMHRDVKPANIWLESGSGRVKVLDFGLARAIASDVNLTQSGIIAGTPQYMAPEQADGTAIDARCDLFSLGCVVYRMATGEVPFAGATTMAILRAVELNQPRPPQELNPEVPPALAELILQLLGKKPSDRPASASAVAETLSAISTMPAGTALSPVRKLKIRSRRFRALTAASVLLVALGLAGYAFGPAIIRVVTPEGTLVVEIDDPDVKVTIEGDGGIVISGAGPQEVGLRPGSYKVQATKDGKPVPLDRELVTIRRGDKQVVTVRLETKHQPVAIPQEQPLAPSEVRRFVGHTSGINGLAVSRDGRRVLSGARDKTLRLWDVQTGKEVRRFEGHTGNVSWVALSPDGRRALSISHYFDATVRFWDVETGKELPFWKLGAAWAVAFSPDGLRFLTSDHDHKLRLWELASGKELQRFEGHTHEARSVAFSPNGRLILSGSRDKTMRLWDAETGKELRRFEGHNAWVWSVTFSPDGRRALSGGADLTMRLWDIDSGKEIRRFDHSPPDRFDNPAFSPDGHYALSCGHRGVRLWDIETGRLLHQFQGHTAPVENVAFTPDGRYALSAGWDGDNTIRLWKLPRPVAKVAPGAFVILGAKGVQVGRFDTLADAVFAAGSGDTIEVRGDGPFVCAPIHLGKQALTIRAGDGFRPVLRPNLETAQANSSLLFTDAALVLEGIEFQRPDPRASRPGESDPILVFSRGQSLHVSNCRFHIIADCIYCFSPVCILRNCEFLSPSGSAVYGRSDVVRLLIMDNCVALGDHVVTIFHCFSPDQPDRCIQLTHNTVGDVNAIEFGLSTVPKAGAEQQGVKPLRVKASANVFDVSPAVGFNQTPSFLRVNKALAPDEAEAILLRSLTWQDDRNLYSRGGCYVSWFRAPSYYDAPHGPKNVAEWKSFWCEHDADCREGIVRYQGGNLLAKLMNTPVQLTPEDFRLRPDSAGYRAGKDGKDLGADVDLVGPGKAYERWRKTPEYQLWLKETRQLN